MSGTVLLVFAGYILFHFGMKLLGQPSGETGITLIPAKYSECKGCQITIKKNLEVSVTTEDKTKKTLITATNMKLDELLRSKNGPGHERIVFSYPGGKPRFVIAGRPLNTQLSPEEMNKEGYNYPADGFGYLILPRESDFTGIGGEMPITWVKAPHQE